MLSDHGTNLLALGVLAGLALALAAGAVWLYRQFNFSPAAFPIYMLNIALTRILWRAKVVGRVPFTRGQGAVIVCNHRGPVDPAFIALACDRQVHWMVAREYVEHPAYAWAFRIFEVIPTSRGGIDTAATRLAVRYAASGELVGMFPEGRINRTDRLMLPGRHGAALVALKARVPVVPCYLTGSPDSDVLFGFLFQPRRAELRVGLPIDITPYAQRGDDRQVQLDLTRRFLQEIAALAGQPDYLPELAGRHWKPDQNSSQRAEGRG